MGTRSVETVIVGGGQAGWMVDMGSANLVGLVRDAEALAARLPR